jgi:deazaflavin-dependent oxidoreductase (nitroreductase family)
MTMPDDLRAYNRKLIEEFRADGGKSMGDRPLLLLTTVGRRSGEPRTSPMMYVKDQDRLLVIASNNGAASDPLWFTNLVADPDVVVEVPGESYPARAEPLDGDEYDRQWAAIRQRYPFFTEHQARAGDRRIPIVALARAN